MGKRWLVTSVLDESPLLTGDELIRVGTVSADDARRDLNIGFYGPMGNAKTVEIELLRAGKPLTLTYNLPGPTPTELLDRQNGPWFISFIFWLAGGAALLFLRPHGLQRRLLALFCFLTAAWLSTGNVSGLHYMGGAIALRALVWLSVPVYLHLHWLFPTPLHPLPKRVWAGIYAFFTLLAAASLFQLIPPDLYMAGFILSMLGSLALLGAHAITQPDERTVLRGLLLALGLVLLPTLVAAALFLIINQLVFGQVIVFGLMALPGFYFYTLYIRQLAPSQNHRAIRLVRAYFILVDGGLLFCLAFTMVAGLLFANTNDSSLTLVIPLVLLFITPLSFMPFLVLPALADEHLTLTLGHNSFGFSANRAAPNLIFLFLQALTSLSIYLLARLLPFPGADSLAILLALFSCTLLGFYLAPFRRAFERHVLAMPLPPESLLTSLAARITTTLELDALRDLLLTEVLPSLLVRQFAQLTCQSHQLVPLFTLRVETSNLPGLDSLPALEQAAGRFLHLEPTSPQADPTGLPAWVRLVLPLRASDQLRGYWLLGQRDPDDRYTPAEITLLQTLAGQTAIALINIDQTVALRTIYFDDIERHEAERLHLAAELHDDVLNQLAALNLHLESTSPAARAAYNRTVLRVREIITGLRPAMLNYGLRTALQELVDEFNDRHPHGPRLLLELPPPALDLRYPARVELSLFRVVQQACANAIQHAACQTIRIQGSLDPDSASLTILDDGHGFTAPTPLDLPSLLVDKHFGLAGMLERAVLIGAALQIHSVPSQGARIEITWPSP